MTECSPGDGADLDAKDHRFSGWQGTRIAPAAASDQIDRLIDGSAGLRGPAAQLELERILDDLEGALVPTCSCGWRGEREPWAALDARSRTGGAQHRQHLQSVGRSDAIRHSATSALREAANDWDGNPDVSRWLRARADGADAQSAET